MNLPVMLAEDSNSDSDNVDDGETVFDVVDDSDDNSDEDSNDDDALMEKYTVHDNDDVDDDDVDNDDEEEDQNEDIAIAVDGTSHEIHLSDEDRGLLMNAMVQLQDMDLAEQIIQAAIASEGGSEKYEPWKFFPDENFFQTLEAAVNARNVESIQRLLRGMDLGDIMMRAVPLLLKYPSSFMFLAHNASEMDVRKGTPHATMSDLLQHTVTEYGDVAVAVAIIHAGADVSADHHAVVQLAVECGNDASVEMLKMLFSNGAVATTDALGIALDSYSTTNNKDCSVIALLLEHGAVVDYDTVVDLELDPVKDREVLSLLSRALQNQNNRQLQQQLQQRQQVYHHRG